MLLTLCSHDSGSSATLPVVGKRYTHLVPCICEASFIWRTETESITFFLWWLGGRKERINIYWLIYTVRYNFSHIHIPNRLYLLSSSCRWGKEVAQYCVTLKGVNLNLGAAPQQTLGSIRAGTKSAFLLGLFVLFYTGELNPRFQEVCFQEIISLMPATGSDSDTYKMLRRKCRMGGWACSEVQLECMEPWTGLPSIFQ